MGIKSSIKIRIICFLAITSPFCNAQENTLEVDKTVSLKESVKSVHSFYSFIKQDISPIVKYRIFLGNDVGSDGDYEFNKEGFLIKKTAFLKFKKNNYEMDPTKKIYVYEYDPNDFNPKKDLFSYFKIPKIIDINCAVKINHAIKTGLESNAKDSKINTNWFNTKEQNQYQYKIEDNKITEEKIYKTSPSKIIFNSPLEKDLYVIKTFIYDSTGNLIQCNFEYKTVNYLYALALDYFTNFCGSNLKFYYDDKNKITKTTLNNDRETLVSETYTYDPTGSYIQKKHRVGKQYNLYPSDEIEFTYNENDDLLEVHFITEDEINQPANRYYEYEYDNHKNWIKCKMFLEGNKNDVTAILERKIEYYQ